jgi:hypothetical protein
MNFIKLLAMRTAGSIYETITFQSFTQRLIRRKISNFVRGESKCSWEDGRTNAMKRAPVPSAEECERLNREAARSI